MSIILNDNIKINAGKPSESKYLNGVVDYVSEAEVISLIPISERHLGLTVRVNGFEFWFESSVDDISLVSKGVGSTAGVFTQDESTFAIKPFSGGSAVSTGSYSIVVGGQDGTATGDFSFVAGGQRNTASGEGSSASGYETVASGSISHTEGFRTTAGEYMSHAEGTDTSALGGSSHAEGRLTLSSGPNSHAEGRKTSAVTLDCHSEGFGTLASGDASHAEGRYSTSSGKYSHAEGHGTIASGDLGSHAEGRYSTASGRYGHAEGYNTVASADATHSEGYTTLASAEAAHAEGFSTTALGRNSHAEGWYALASGFTSHAEGAYTQANAGQSHAEGGYTQANGYQSHAEGYMTIAGGYRSHAEGESSQANGRASHAQGELTVSYSRGSHAGGYKTMVSGETSFAHSRESTIEIGADNSSILGGFSNRLTSLATGSTILGGTGITGSTPDTVYGVNFDASGNIYSGGTDVSDLFLSSSLTLGQVTVNGTIYVNSNGYSGIELGTEDQPFQTIEAANDYRNSGATSGLRTVQKIVVMPGDYTATTMVPNNVIMHFEEGAKITSQVSMFDSDVDGGTLDITGKGHFTFGGEGRFIENSHKDFVTNAEAMFITNNTSYTRQGSIFRQFNQTSATGATFTLKNTYLSGVSGTIGSTLFLIEDSNLEIINCKLSQVSWRFLDIRTRVAGVRSNVVVKDSVLEDSNPIVDGGFWVTADCDLTIIDSVFTYPNKVSSGQGSLLYITPNVNTKFLGNNFIYDTSGDPSILFVSNTSNTEVNVTGSLYASSDFSIANGYDYNVNVGSLIIDTGVTAYSTHITESNSINYK